MIFYLSMHEIGKSRLFFGLKEFESFEVLYMDPSYFTVKAYQVSYTITQKDWNLELNQEYLNVTYWGNKFKSLFSSSAN